jgi:hypothetical protein
MRPSRTATCVASSRAGFIVMMRFARKMVIMRGSDDDAVSRTPDSQGEDPPLPVLHGERAG